MTFASIRALPSGVREHLPKHAQEIYRKAYNHAWDEYEQAGRRWDGVSREETAHRVAWAAVKRLYDKDEDSGLWKRRD